MNTPGDFEDTWPLGPPLPRGAKPAESEGYDDPAHWHLSRDHPGLEESDDIPPRWRTCEKPKP